MNIDATGGQVERYLVKLAILAAYDLAEVDLNLTNMEAVLTRMRLGKAGEREQE